PPRGGGGWGGGPRRRTAPAEILVCAQTRARPLPLPPPSRGGEFRPMAFTPQFLDELRNRLSIASSVGKRVKLQRRGREQIGLCPFHSEKTPSFTVSEE